MTGDTSTVDFSIDNADNLFAEGNGADAAYSTLGGPNTGGGFDYGLPFFYGKKCIHAPSMGRRFRRVLRRRPGGPTRPRGLIISHLTHGSMPWAFYFLPAALPPGQFGERHNPSYTIPHEEL